MRRRAPGVVGEGVELADGVDPRQRVGGGQFARRDRDQRRGAMAALERIERACRARPRIMAARPPPHTRARNSSTLCVSSPAASAS